MGSVRVRMSSGKERSWDPFMNTVPCRPLTSAGGGCVCARARACVYVYVYVSMCVFVCVQGQEVA